MALLGFGSAAMCALALIFMAGWFVLIREADAATVPSSAGSPLAWRVVSVSASGVTVKLGADEASTSAVVRVGARLPNGETLLATVPTRQAYMTGSATVILKPNPGPAMPPSAPRASADAPGS